MIRRNMIAEKESDLDAVARIVRQLRSDQGLSQEKLAELAGMRQATVSEIEQGKDARVSTICRLARALKVKAGDLLPG